MPKFLLGSRAVPLPVCWTPPPGDLLRCGRTRLEPSQLWTSQAPPRVPKGSTPWPPPNRLRPGVPHHQPPSLQATNPESFSAHSRRLPKCLLNPSHTLLDTPPELPKANGASETRGHFSNILQHRQVEVAGSLEGGRVGLGGSGCRPGNLYFDKPQMHVGHRPLPTNTRVIELLPAETALALQSPRSGDGHPPGHPNG